MESVVCGKQEGKGRWLGSEGGSMLSFSQLVGLGGWSPRLVACGQGSFEQIPVSGLGERACEGLMWLEFLTQVSHGSGAPHTYLMECSLQKLREAGPHGYILQGGIHS